MKFELSNDFMPRQKMSESSPADNVDRESKLQPKHVKNLGRRPIHQNHENMEEGQEDDFNDKKKSKNLYPDLPDGELDTEAETVDTEASKEQPESSIFKYLWAVLVIVIAYFIGSTLQAPDRGAKANLDEIVEAMQNHFTNQNPWTYRIVKSALKKVVNLSNEPSAPAIITVISNKNAESRAAEFSLYLARALVDQNYVLINESTYWQSSPDDIKLKIDEDIRSKMKNDSLNVVIVDKLHNIPYEAAMIFHGYCDHELAPYKRALFLFHVPLTVILPEDASQKQIDSAGMRQLKNIWPLASSDVIDSLITRITVNVVNIR